MESRATVQRTGTRRVASSKVTPLQGQAMVLHIELCDILPTIYRVVVVPARITLPKLHVTILWAMGWEGGHLHEFIINGEHYGELDPEFPYPDMKSQQRVRLDKALGAARQFEYLYDYGDAWWHRITVLEVAQFQGPLDSPWCLDGAHACPPEDVGGAPGYADFLQAINDPSHPDHARMVQWYGGPFDPEDFDIEAVNQRLIEIRF